MIYEHTAHLFITVNHYKQNEMRLLSETVINNTNKTSDLFYIGFKVFIIQNGMICEMFLYMVNVMEYGIQYFLKTIEHQYLIFYKLFITYNILALDKMYAVWACQKLTGVEGVIESTVIFLSSRGLIDGYMILQDIAQFELLMNHRIFSKTLFFTHSIKAIFN
eukprot:154413_1